MEPCWRALLRCGGSAEGESSTSQLCALVSAPLPLPRAGAGLLQRGAVSKGTAPRGRNACPLAAELSGTG